MIYNAEQSPVEIWCHSQISQLLIRADIRTANDPDLRQVIGRDRQLDNHMSYENTMRILALCKPAADLKHGKH